MKREKIASCFRNKIYVNELPKVVKSIKRWVIDVIKREKSDKDFPCNNKAQIIMKSVVFQEVKI